MNMPKLNGDQLKKVILSLMGFVFLLYAYSNFFLGPLNRSRGTMQTKMKATQEKLDRSKDDLSKAASLEKSARSATTRFAAFKALNPEGAPIAWFPPRMKTFFANQQIDKAGVRLENTASLKEPELANWTNYTWIIDLPQADYAALGKAIAQLENSEPLMAIRKLNIRAITDQQQFQQVTITAVNCIPKQ
jgi:hypothetical protein